MFRAMHAILLLALAAPVIAQDGASTSGVQADGKKVYVAFRMEDWNAKHIHDAAQLKSYTDTLKTLGVEVKTSQHSGHTDVQCRTIFWKSMVLDTADQADKWITWLQQSGFDTIRGLKAGSTPASTSNQTREIVQYRQVDWRSQHIHDSNELNQLLALYRALGCEIEQSSHNGHTDVKSRCPEWMEIELPNHDAAHKWQDFLNKGGFETKHEH